MNATGSTSNGTEQNKQVAHRAQDEDTHNAAAIGVGFDGRYYRYRSYRYDLCSDAVRYAELDRYKPQYREKIIQSAPWERAVEPTDAEQHVMKAHGITFDGKYYHYAGYRYERCADAANYADLRSHGQGLTDDVKRGRTM